MANDFKETGYVGGGANQVGPAMATNIGATRVAEDRRSLEMMIDQQDRANAKLRDLIGRMSELRDRVFGPAPEGGEKGLEAASYGQVDQMRRGQAEHDELLSEAHALMNTLEQL